MATTIGRNSKRASVILKQRQKIWQDQFAACHGDTKKVKAAAKEYHKKYGATPTARWKKALRDAKKAGHEKQTSLRLR